MALNQSSKPRFPRINDFFGADLSLSDFTVKGKLGEGTFGQVGLYEHKQTGREYAIKRIPLFRKKGKRYMSPQQIIQLTKKELDILYKIDNEHIIQLVDHFQDNEAVYLITEYLKGDNLYEITIKKGRKLPPDMVADIGYQICTGLAELHAYHVIHRDIKLENLIFHNGFIKIVDLGQNIERHTTIGTKVYWSPQILNSEEQNDRLDVWCTGVVLYELLFNKQPFEEKDFQRKKCEFSWPSNYQPDPDLEDFFRRIFTPKNNRIKAHELKRHPWIKKNRGEKEIQNGKFEDYYTEDEVRNYRQLLGQAIQDNKQYLDSLKKRTSMLEGMLRQARRQLKKMPPLQ